MNTEPMIARSQQNRPRNLLLMATLVLVSGCISAAQTAPRITGFLVDGIKSNHAAVGAILTIQGSGFGDSEGFSIASLGGILLAGPGVSPIGWSDTSIVVVIPQTVCSGAVVVTVHGSGSSNPMNLNVRVEITGAKPDSGPPGQGVTISGNGFGTQGGTVTFNGVPAVVGGWTDGSIVATVPDGATAGPIRVTVANHVSNGWPFTPTP